MSLLHPHPLPQNEMDVVLQALVLVDLPQKQINFVLDPLVFVFVFVAVVVVVIYADFECLTRPINKCSKNPDQSSTQAYQHHEPSSFTIHVVGHKSRDPIEYRGSNCVTKFLEVLKELEIEIVGEVKANKPMNELTESEQCKFLDPKVCCHFCQKPCGDDRVKDHDHITGDYRGPAHSKCNIEEGKKNTRRYKIPVIFHNLKNYDGHLIIQNVGNHTS
eukprot:SAG11_NODE_12145_length_719_cov_143.916129_1_plen_217_part_10